MLTFNARETGVSKHTLKLRSVKSLFVCDGVETRGNMRGIRNDIVTVLLTDSGRCEGTMPLVGGSTALDHPPPG